MSASSRNCLAASKAPVWRVGATTLGCHDYSRPSLCLAMPCSCAQMPTCLLGCQSCCILDALAEQNDVTSRCHPSLYLYTRVKCVASADPRVGLLGAMQSLFEGSMYTFVFLWTPALSPDGEHLPHGMIFACFMVSSMAGSALAGRLLAQGSGYFSLTHCVMFHCCLAQDSQIAAFLLLYDQSECIPELSPTPTLSFMFCALLADKNPLAAILACCVPFLCLGILLSSCV